MVGGVEHSGVREPFDSELDMRCTFKAVGGYVRGIMSTLPGIDALMMRLFRLS